jgi:ABC-2 type transport system ATP-binding protein
MGLGYPDSGSILVYGEPPGSRKRGMIGYLSGQFEPPYDWWTVREAVDHHGRYFATWDSRLAWDLLDRLEVNPGIRLGTLSSGERRRVQLVLALSARSQFLVLDEPLARIDQSGFRLVSTLIGAHIHEHPGTTVLMATHDTEPFLDLNPATLLLQDGIAEQVGDGPPPKTDG